MKAFIVFAAVIAVAAANAVGRSGWGSGSAVPTVEIDLTGAAAAAASGHADANQILSEIVSGTVDGPASLLSASGLLADVSQGEDVSQVVVVDKPSGASSTVNVVDVGNEAIGIDSLDAVLEGANYAIVDNSASTSADGQGSIAAEAFSLNAESSRK